MLRKNLEFLTKSGGSRDSGIELFRIITMLVIVAHHYVVNSGLVQEISATPSLGVNSIFLLLFGWGGKTGINCFVLITGYFMCKSKITLRKFLKLVLWMEFYKVIFFLIFTLSGYQPFSIKAAIKSLLPVTSVADGFGSAYLVFYLFIPFLNILVQNMDRKKHLLLMVLCISVYTILPILLINVVFNYVTWFSVIYIVGSYIRLYPEPWFESKRLWGWLTFLLLIVSWASVIGIAWLTLRFRGSVSMQYFFVADSNKPLALLTAVAAFMFFKNLNIGYHKGINVIAASSFGVLLIHANSDTMRQWLWKDTLQNVSFFNSNILYIHAIGSVVGIYVICTLIDMVRKNTFEKVFFNWYDKRFKK